MAAGDSIVTEYFMATIYGPYINPGYTAGSDNLIGMDCDQIKLRYNVYVSGITTTGHRLPSQNQIGFGPTTSTTSTSTTTSSCTFSPNAVYAGMASAWSTVFGDPWGEAREADGDLFSYRNYDELLGGSSDTRWYGFKRNLGLYTFRRANFAFNMCGAGTGITAATISINASPTSQNVILVMNTGATAGTNWPEIPLNKNCYWNQGWAGSGYTTSRDNWIVQEKTSLVSGWNTFTIPSRFFYALQSNKWITFTLMVDSDWLDSEPLDSPYDYYFDLTIGTSYRPYLTITK